ncbi:MAG: phosphodiester glycosidase family protein [Muribaculaceae bacterium]|nr:phosphodiester glycosidase family protein [Muribaculaceae bacterium]
MKKSILTLIVSLTTISSMWGDIMINDKSYQADTLICKEIGPGVIYTRIRIPDYPLNVNTLKVDLNNKYNRLETTVGQDKLGSTESLVSAAKRQTTEGHRALAAANANFWCTVEKPFADYIKGTTFGANLRNGKILTETNMFSDQWDGGAERTGIVSIDTNKKLWIESMSWEGLATSEKWNGNKLTIAQVNKMCNDNELVMYNSYYGTSRAFTTVGEGVARTDVFLKMKEGQEWSVNKDMIFDVKEIKPNTGANTLGDYDLCISGTGSYKTSVELLAIGDEVKINHAWKSFATGDTPNLEQVVAGNAIVMKDGVLTGRNTDEGYNSQVYSRTGYGMDKEGKTLYVIVIDKSTDPVYGYSAGCGTSVMCEIMKQAGCWNLCTMDAGGSAQMMVQDAIINKTTEGSPRAVANGMMIYSIAEPQTQIARLEYADYKLLAPIYSSYQPIIYGYDKYGNLIDEDVKGFTLSCDASLGSTEGTTFTAVGQPVKGKLTATLNGISVSKEMTVMNASMSLRIKNLLIDASREYPVEVVAQINANEYKYNPASLTWTVADPSIVSINEQGILKGLKEGETTISCKLGDFSDQGTVKVEIANNEKINLSYEDWTFTSSVANTFVLGADGVLTMNYKGGRAASFKMAKEQYFYSLPDKVLLSFTSTLPISSIQADFRNATQTSTNILKLSEEAGYAAGVRYDIELPLSHIGGGDDLLNFPLSLRSLNFYVGTGATVGTNTVTFHGIYGQYNHHSGVETIKGERASEFTIYPNPVSEGMITITSELQEAKVEIFNNAGVLMHSQVVNLNGTSATLDVTMLSQGLYFIRLQGENSINVEKLIIK